MLERKAHPANKLLQFFAASIVPSLQPRSHVCRMPHGLIQGPVAHQGKVVVVHSPAGTSGSVQLNLEAWLFGKQVALHDMK